MKRIIIVAALSVGSVFAVSAAQANVSPRPLQGQFPAQLWCAPGGQAKLTVDTLQVTPFGQDVIHNRAFLGPKKSTMLCG